MTGEVPRFIFQPGMNPATGAIIKAAMCSSALLIALFAALMPKYFGIDDTLILGTLYAVALTDFVMAFFLPSVIEKQARKAYSFFDDRLVIKAGAGEYTLTYDNISAVEEAVSAKAGAQGFVTVRLLTKQPARIPFLSNDTCVILSSLPVHEAPLAKIKEVVEKSRTS